MDEIEIWIIDRAPRRHRCRARPWACAHAFDFDRRILAVEKSDAREDIAFLMADRENEPRLRLSAISASASNERRRDRLFDEDIGAGR